MSDLFTAKAQRNITYTWLVMFFGVIVGGALGYLKNVPYETLFSLTSVILFFWFQRTRTDKSNGEPK